MSAMLRGSLEAELLPGARTISYIVSQKGNVFTMRVTRPDGAPYDRLDQSRPADRYWVESH